MNYSKLLFLLTLDNCLCLFHFDYSTSRLLFLSQFELLQIVIFIDTR
nr:MAG TPA: hypothetical protein [Caudoviricetes sp.]